MKPKLVELRPDRNLLNPNFNGYKLSLESIPILRKELDNEVHKVLLNQNQYSLLHAKLFGLHNHLFTDHFCESESVYFIDETWSVKKVTVNQDTARLEDIKEVWTIPQCEKNVNHYNVSLKFISTELVILSDGHGGLHLLETGARNQALTWNSVYYERVLDDKAFILVDAVCKVIEADKRQVHCVLVSIDRNEDKFITSINWIRIDELAGSWGQMSLKVLQGETFHYIALERNCDYIYVASDKSFKFVLDSECPIIENVEPKTDVKVYTWQQTTDDVTLRFNVPANCERSDVIVDVSPMKISVQCKQIVFVEGDFVNRVDSDLTTWNVENGILEIALVKSESGLMWDGVVSGDDRGEHIIDESTVAEVHQRLPHLCSETEVISQETGPCFNSQQIEECDFDGDNMAIFERLSAANHEVTHRINIGSHQVIMSLELSVQSAPAIVLRHDVDACIWQPTSNGDSWCLKHEGTLYAFGYVQASKQQRKFSSCSPDLGYSVISESMRHIFIYRQSKCVESGELRNRRSGQKVNAVAEQQVISLSENEILGLSATKNVLYVLSDKSVLALKI